MGTLPLSDLLLLIQTGDADAFRQLYHQYKESIYWTVYKRLGDEEEAKDLVQEIFLTVWTKREQLTQLEALDTYLYGIARNKVISVYRKRNLQLKSEDHLMYHLQQLDHAADDNMIVRQLNDSVDEAVAQLPATMQACFNLSKNEGKKVKDIAALLNLSEQTVRNNLSEALKRLRITLQSSYPELLVLAIILALGD